jgi:hypothetical protein
MNATGEEGERPTGLPTTCRYSKGIVGRYRVDSSPFAVGKVKTSVSQMSVAALPRDTTKTILFKIREGRTFANRSEFGLKPYVVDGIGEL